MQHAPVIQYSSHIYTTLKKNLRHYFYQSDCYFEEFSIASGLTSHITDRFSWNFHLSVYVEPCFGHCCTVIDCYLSHSQTENRFLI